MAKYRNTSGVTQHIAEHRFIAPNAEVDFSPEDMKLEGVKQGISKGGWFLPVLEDIIGQVVDQEADNVLNHITGQPENPFDLNIPIGGLVNEPKTKKSTKKTVVNPTQSIKDKAIAEALAREQVRRNTEAREKAIRQALGQSDDEKLYQHRPIKRGEYGNIEHNMTDINPSTPFGTIEYPSANLEAMKNAFLDQEEASLVETPKIQPKKVAVKKAAAPPKKSVKKK